MFNLKEYMKSKGALIEKTLDNSFTSNVSKSLTESMKYSLMGGGKRLRPILVLSSWDMLSTEEGKYEKIMPLACAIEMIHTYSLIHDDLPAMDNDDLRRGKPTNHKVYGEGMAILAGDALLTEAFAVMSSLTEYHPGDNVAKTVRYIAKAAGMNGMVGGQVLDIENSGSRDIDEEYLYRTSNCKTGELITASVVSPAVLLGREGDIENLEGYGKAIGVAFQMVDDVLGRISSKEELGKTPNIDSENKKVTFVDLFGVDGTKERAKQEVDRAKNFLSFYGAKAEPFINLADYIVSRTF